MSGLAALVLAAGRGSRLRPLTDTTPKPLLEVGGRTLLDLALDRVATVLPVDAAHVAVNAHWLADQIRAHVGDRVHLSVEEPEALGTAGAVGQLQDWLAGRDLLIANGDAWYDPAPDLVELVRSWDGRRPRLLVTADQERPDFEGRWRFAGTSLLPSSLAGKLAPVPSGLYELVWSKAPVELVPTDVAFVDCGTPEDLSRARGRAEVMRWTEPRERNHL
ncbi:MAG TPA: sugar phosphate nucleotidyltransferase [Mycobacteriales bacterium]|nr:sugar phosphate nucleotidyltransferase [Mycobacteriales bacterium]